MLLSVLCHAQLASSFPTGSLSSETTPFPLGMGYFYGDRGTTGTVPIRQLPGRDHLDL